jgi:hypothetical protein
LSACQNVADLEPLRGMQLRSLSINATRVASLAPLAKAPLEDLNCEFCLIRDHRTLQGMPLKELNLDFNRWRDSELVRDLKKLESINGKPAAEFWKEVDAERAKFDAWAAKVAKLPPEEQVKEVAAELKRLNPGFDGKFNPISVVNGVVQELGFNAAEVTDLSPLRALAGLKSLSCTNGDPALPVGKRAALPAGKLADLSPLEGLKLKSLALEGCQVRDLVPLREMPIEVLLLPRTQVENLRPIEKMPLRSLNIEGTRVTNLAPLTYVPLRTLWCDLPLTRDVLLRTIKTLERINDKAAAEVLK